MSASEAANETLAFLGVKLTPMAEMYADLHKAYEELLVEHAAVCLAAQAVIDVWGDDLLLEQGRLVDVMEVLDEALP